MARRPGYRRLPRLAAFAAALAVPGPALAQDVPRRPLAPSAEMRTETGSAPARDGTGAGGPTGSASVARNEATAYRRGGQCPGLEAASPPARRPWYGAWLVLSTGIAAALFVHAALRARSRRAIERLSIRYAATVEERTRVAQALHDTLLQKFNAAILELGMVQRAIRSRPETADTALGRAITIATSAVREARLAVWDMRAHEVRRELPEALADAVRELVPPEAIELEVCVRGQRIPLLPEVEDVLLRVGREAVANAVRHARPGRIAVLLAYEPRRVRLEVRDDGEGCTLEGGEVASPNGHWGLRTIREQAAKAGGTLVVQGRKGQGTRVDLFVPILHGRQVRESRPGSSGDSWRALADRIRGVRRRDPSRSRRAPAEAWSGVGGAARR